MKRSPIRRSTKPMKRTAMSRKPGKRQEAWKRRAAGIPLDHCRLCWYSKCWGPLQRHHVRVRGMGGVENDTSPIVVLCAKHHAYTHEHPEWARERGLLERRYTEPAAG